MKKSIQILLFSATILVAASCANKKKDDVVPSTAKTSEADMKFVDADAKTTEGHYCRRTTYTPDLADNYFSIRHFPNAAKPTPLIIAIHGGAFIGGHPFGMPVKVGVGPDNSGISYEVFNQQQLNNQGFALASIDYTLINSGKTVNGVKVTGKNTLEDCQDFLDYIIKHYNVYNIDTTKIILMGFSGGASTSLWLGLDNDKGYTDNIKGIIAFSPQASLNFPTWREKIFVPMNLAGIYDQRVDLTKPLAIGPYSAGQYFNMMFGTADIGQVDQFCTDNDLNFMKLIDPTDPELFLGCFAADTDIVHHRAHTLSLAARAYNKGLAAKIAYIFDPYYYDPSESPMQFCVRKCK